MSNIAQASGSQLSSLQAHWAARRVMASGLLSPRPVAVLEMIVLKEG